MTLIGSSSFHSGVMTLFACEVGDLVAVEILSYCAIETPGHSLRAKNAFTLVHYFAGRGHCYADYDQVMILSSTLHWTGLPAT